MSSRLVKRIYYGVQLSLDTPFCVSNGENEMTDCDVLTDWEGTPFIPGTSWAGAFRAFLAEEKENVDVLFGSSDEKTGKMSRIWISDLYFDKPVSTAIRDGVLLKNRVAVDEKKYDYEVVEYGSGTLFLQLCIWEEDAEKLSEENAEEAVRKMIGGIRSGDIRIGAQKNRGLGKLKVENVYCREFSGKNVGEWINFDRKTLLEDSYKKDLDIWCIQPEQYVTIRVPLMLTGGLSIRKYSTRKNEPDFISLMRKVEDHEEKTVIPGSSWKGAIRSRIEEIILNLDAAEQLHDPCKQIFGFVKEGLGKKQEETVSKMSEWTVAESVLETETFVKSIRNSISRFENATVQGALFSERFAAGGTTELEIKVRKKGNTTDWFVGLLLLAVRDIQNGYLSVGGGAAIGRGIFRADGEIKIENGMTKKEYLLALHEKLEGGA